MTPRRIAILVLLAVLLAGIASGVMLRDVVEDLGGKPARGERRPAPEGQSDNLVSGGAEEDFLEELGLPEEQNKAVERLLDERENRLEKYWEGKLPEIQALIDSSRVAIRNMLPPEHQVAYDRWVERQRVRTPGD